MTEQDWEAFVASVRKDPARAGFILDFDGTLSGIAPTPAEARALPGASGVLATLAGRYPLVAILSGRRAEDVLGLIPARGVRYLGLYGAEELGPRRPSRRRVGPRRPSRRRVGSSEALLTPRSPAAGLVDEARTFIQHEGLTGAEVEDKGHSVALHYRNATSPAAGEVIEAWAQERAEGLGLQVRPGKMVVELTSPGPTKAEALERLVAGSGIRRLVVAGDDVADVGALRRAGELLGTGALRIGVRSPEAPAELEEVADVMVPGPEGVLEFLSRFA
ncbi:MAG TPA: trehalose-phosphatase [Actinomycetota bacterium]|nr:trehalose-phosphatase [Actinomycetota bacterium]